VQGRKHHVTRERGFDTHGDGFVVARLADHDDVWVSPQKRTHQHSKVDTRFFVDLHLAQTFLCDLDWVFRGPNFGIRRVELGKDRMQRGGFTRAGGAADVKQAIGFVDHAFQALHVVRRQPQLIQRNGFAAGQDTHDHVFDTAS
jgi:hypothetical protein